ncbi:hypothetical protein [Proteus hauseri]|uniref:hypothetical protein n=1 Tax=Proteus hauseri TaxID=183417 RepID=UPI00100956DB|nr:hypothetical protein [Proteus hauseri]QAV22362.1 hypothetical protein PH4a_02980 [Proteus hauseri]
MTLFEFMNSSRTDGFLCKRVHCNDGYYVSIQASYGHYCSPRQDLPSEDDQLINAYAECDDCFTETVYPYVPKEVVIALIEKHGGVKVS